VQERAERGDPEGQNALGYMLYRGEGAAADTAKARAWFERAAAAGSVRARRNLDFLDGGAPKLARPAVSRGETLYSRFCAGCHGLVGVAAYENSPSFAFNERLGKSDAELMRSVLDGNQEMPGWGGKLPEADLREIFAFVRTLPARYDAGIGVEAPELPPYMYLFGRMEERRRGLDPFIPR
jgi:TPR repeat protein